MCRFVHCTTFGHLHYSHNTSFLYISHCNSKKKRCGYVRPYTQYRTSTGWFISCHIIINSVLYYTWHQGSRKMKIIHRGWGTTKYDASIS